MAPWPPPLPWETGSMRSTIPYAPIVTGSELTNIAPVINGVPTLPENNGERHARKWPIVLGVIVVLALVGLVPILRGSVSSGVARPCLTWPVRRRMPPHGRLRPKASP